ncbi:MAG TPA: non-homologous end-joining DNA ligase [Bryobacteraceae bacterium]|jgi:bifunctional non-homologous end joining protein LigD
MTPAVHVTHPDKVLFPRDGITKREFVEYYRRIAGVMLPHLRGRAIAMERYPDGIGGPRIFQKNASAYFPEWVKTVALKKQGGTVRHVVCDDADTLAYLANQAVITPHTWLSRVDKPDRPDQMIFDLDPPEGQFREVCATAKRLRELLKDAGLTAFVKTTGSRGLHVLAPLKRRKTFDEVRAWARQIAEELVHDNPKRLTLEIRKNKRGRRIFVDTARNAYAQTAAPAYAVRARDGAPVAAPIEWKELDRPGLRPDQFNIRNIFERLESVGDLWKGAVA